MDKFIIAGKSRTVWTVIAMVIVNGVPSVAGMIPEAYVPLVNMVLGVLAAYFRINHKA